MITKLNREQALELAKIFKISALTVGNYTVKHWAELTSSQRERLNSMEWSLFNASEDMINLEAQLALDDLEAVLEKIEKATRAATNAIKKIETTKKAISIAAALLTLASAIMSKSPGAILGALKDIVNEVRKG
jgi:hypothetical protein